ncbi:unnamed protein product [Microthlaspi erraticum]|uniref:F-box domain-containing protein n=1 Tax=Microthlaspi erraticum TaxID=1685480 RepID=A0A6D2L6I1_9BRAS|nr:unnamed protein product [Microthlaspi erraticum]
MVPSQEQRLYICLMDLRDNRNSVILSSSAPNGTPSTFVVNNDLTIPWVGLNTLHNLHGFVGNSTTTPQIYNPSVGRRHTLHNRCRHGFVRSSYSTTKPQIYNPWVGLYTLQNLHGFMCNAYSTTMPQIHNPTTRQLVTLPAIYSDPPKDSMFFYYFGHDPVNDQYKVICSMVICVGTLAYRRTPEYWVLVLKPGASWKKAAPASVDFCLNLRKRRSEARQEIQIPMDLVTEILTRLPAKSVMKFKWVSKLWSSLIRSQYFSSRFLMVPSQEQHLYICLSDRIDNRNSVILSSSAPHSTPTASTFVVNNDVTIQWRGSYNLQNLHGFIFFYYFGHDPVNDQYKVICSMVVISGTTAFKRKSEYLPWVLVLKPGGSWKKAAPASVEFCLDHVPLLKPGLSFNGVIYFLASACATYNYLADQLEQIKYVMVSFDIAYEEFRTIQMPRIEGRIHNAILIEYGGNLTVFDTNSLIDEGKVNLWVLKDVLGNKEWSRKTLVLKPSQLHLVHNICLKVKGTTQSGKVLLVPYNFLSPFHILCYDLQSNDMRKIDIKGIREQWFSTRRDIMVNLMFMDQSESILYLDT